MQNMQNIDVREYPFLFFPALTLYAIHWGISYWFAYLGIIVLMFWIIQFIISILLLSNSGLKLVTSYCMEQIIKT